MEQSNAIFSQLQDVSMGVATLLDKFGKQKSGRLNMTLQEEFDTVIEEFQHQIPEAQLYKTDSISLLGGGGFADVYQGFYENRPVAIKRLKLDLREIQHLRKSEIRRDEDRVAAEALLTHKCSIHPNIIEVIGCLPYMNEVECPIIVMELMNTTLYDALRGASRKQALAPARLLYLLNGIAGALEFLHLQGIVHHDVKSLNILLNSEYAVAKLSDFGEAKVKGLNTTTVRQGTIMTTARKQGDGQVAGTVAYQAPEVLCEEVKETSRISEMYSFGVTAWECLTGKVPHAGKKEANIAIFAATKKHLPMLELPVDTPRNLTGVNRLSWEALNTFSMLQVAPIPSKPPKRASDASAGRPPTLPTRPETQDMSSHPVSTGTTAAVVSHNGSPSYWQQPPVSSSLGQSTERDDIKTTQQGSGNTEGNGGYNEKKWAIIIGVAVAVLLVIVVAVAVSAGGGSSETSNTEITPKVPSQFASSSPFAAPVETVTRSSPPAFAPVASPVQSSTATAVPTTAKCEEEKEAYAGCIGNNAFCASCVAEVVAGVEATTCFGFTDMFCNSIDSCKCNECVAPLMSWLDCHFEIDGCVGECAAPKPSSSPASPIPSPASAPTDPSCSVEDMLDTYIACAETLRDGPACRSCAAEVVAGLGSASSECTDITNSFCPAIESCNCGWCVDPLRDYVNCVLDTSLGFPDCIGECSACRRRSLLQRVLDRVGSRRSLQCS